MATMEDKGRPLPKFGEWDVNDPASAEGFSVIFSKARNEKRGNGDGGNAAGPQANVATSRSNGDYQDPAQKRWFCCF